MPLNLLTPLGDNNREEHMLIDFSGFVKNMAEILAITIFENEEACESVIVDKELYNEFKELYKSNRDAFFMATSMLKPEDLLRAFANDSFDDDEDLVLSMDILFENFNYLGQSTSTVYEYALQNIVQKDFCKSITFYLSQQYAFKPYQIKYLHDTFEGYAEKINILEGDYRQEAAENNYTTICTNDIDFIMDALTVWDNDKLEQTFFILMNNNSNITRNEDGSANYLYIEELEKLTKGKKRAVTRLQSQGIPHDEEPENVSHTGTITAPPQSSYEDGDVFTFDDDMEDKTNGI